MTTEFGKILGEIQAMHDKKQQDYGTNEDPFANVRAAADLGIKPWIGCLIRMNDKMKRLHKAARGGTMTNESVEDSLLDLAVYSIIALVLRREEQDGSTRLQKGTLPVDIGRDSYFTTGPGCSGTHVGRLETREGRSDVGRSNKTTEGVQRVTNLEPPPSGEGERISDSLHGEDDSAGRTFRDGMRYNDRVGLLT